MDRREKDTRTDVEREGFRTQAEAEAEVDLRRSRTGERRGAGVDIERESRKSPEEIESDLQRTRAEMEETIEAIERKFSPGEMLDQAIRTLAGGPKEFAFNFGETVKTNPIPATLVAVGLGWLMASSGRQTQVYPVETAFPPEGAGREKGAMFKEKYGQAREKAGSFAGAAVGRVREGLGRISRTIGSGRQAAGERFGHARERVGGMTGYAGEAEARAGEMAGYAGERSREFTGRGQHLLEEQPLVLVALGLAVGAALGASMPVSETEERVAGEYGEDLMERATEVGREQLEKGERVVTKAGEAAKEEAERQEKAKEPEPAI